MKFLYFLAIAISIIIGCNNGENVPQSDSDKKNAAKPLAKKPDVSIVNDTLIRMQFDTANDITPAIAEQLLDGNKHIVCEVTITKADSIYAEVMAVKPPGNVRFTQIIMPDGKADGPFGQELSYLANKPGKYKLIIGENMMAGDKWQGNIRVKVLVK